MESEIAHLCNYWDEIEASILTLQHIQNRFLRVQNPAIPLYRLRPTIQLLQEFSVIKLM